MQSTSLGAYADLKTEGKLSHQQQCILDCMSPGRNYSLQEIKFITKFEINVVSGRVSDLKGLGKLVETEHKRKCSITNKTIQPVMLPTKPLPQKELF